ncbi:MAG: hypothetical protein HY762_06660 [Planctomycetes bacterium]|nr:hypothetical protein [Planctomycetota bacterium]
MKYVAEPQRSPDRSVGVGISIVLSIIAVALAGYLHLAKMSLASSSDEIGVLKLQIDKLQTELAESQRLPAEALAQAGSPALIGGAGE